MDFIKENKKPVKAIKTTTKQKILSQIYITGKALRTLHIQ